MKIFWMALLALLALQLNCLGEDVEYYEEGTHELRTYDNEPYTLHVGKHSKVETPHKCRDRYVELDSNDEHRWILDRKTNTLILK